MKKILLAFALAVSALPFLASAAEVRSGDQVALQSSEKILNNLYLAGGTVTSAATIPGDQVVAGGNIVLSGTVSQDLAAAGGSVTVLSDVGDDLRAIGGTIIVNGKVGGDVVVGGGDIQLSGSAIGGDVFAAGGTVSIREAVSGNVNVRGGKLVIDAPIKGNVYFEGEELVIGKGASIQGALTYGTPHEATTEAGSKIVGKVTFNHSEKDLSKSGAFLLALFSLAVLGKFLMSLATALAVGLIFKKFTKEFVSTSITRPIIELARGFVVIVILPLVSLILLATLVGIPFGVLGLLSIVALIIFSSIVAPILAGSYLHHWYYKTSEFVVSWKTILLGVVVYSLLSFVPVLGALVKIVLFLIACGAVSHMKWEEAKRWQ